MAATALCGHEVLEYILAKLRRDLSEMPEFSVAITHPHFAFSCDLTLTTPHSSTTEVQRHVEADTIPADFPGEKVTRKLKIGAALQTRPGAAREEAGIQPPSKDIVHRDGVIQDMTDYKAGEAPWDKR